MRSFLHVILCFMCLGALGLTQAIPAAAADWCAPPKAPRISIHPTTDNISYDFSLSEKELNQFDVSTVNPYGGNVITDVGGLMKGGIQTQQESTFGNMTNYGTQEICYWHDSINVTIHIHPIVYVAREFPEGSCMHNAILAHEHQHVVIDREIVNKYANLIGQSLQQEVAHYPIYGPAPLSQKETVYAQMKDRVQSIITTYTQQMSAERQQRQQALDNISEYERVNHLCPNERKK